MTNPLHARYYADTLVQRRVKITENVRMARDTFRVRVPCPELAERILPGQFVMLRLAPTSGGPWATDSSPTPWTI
jgi:dihydroorotate dehydrogenase electron transfer subunit